MAEPSGLAGGSGRVGGAARLELEGAGPRGKGRRGRRAAGATGEKPRRLGALGGGALGVDDEEISMGSKGVA